MTLHELLEKEKGQPAKIGFRSGFVFCGILEAPEVMERLFEDQYRKDQRYFLQQINRIEKYLVNFTEIWNEMLKKDLEAELERLKKEPDTPAGTEAKILNTLRRFVERREQAHKRAEDLLHDYVEEIHKPHYLKREVVDKYYSIDPEEEPGTMIYIIDGMKSGRYYTSREYNNDMTEED